MTNIAQSRRLGSLDILRGFDLFALVFFQPVLMQLASALGGDSTIAHIYRTVFTHVDWEGFHAWDLVMPLFLFMTGASIPFAFARFKRGEDSSISMFKRIAKRVLLLWLFGMIVQGNILSLNPDYLVLYSNTLQSIAIGYLFASLIYMYLPERGVLIACLILPIIYTLGMQIYGSYQPYDNLAEVIDRAILGRFIEGASVDENGITQFASWYNYAWIYPSINFTTTVLSGVLTTCLLRSRLAEKRKILYLILIGVSCIALAYTLSTIEPIIKKLWTSSMTLLASGYSILLMALFYWVVDVLQKDKYLNWLKFYGMNSILAYMLFSTLNLSSALNYWLHGFKQYLDEFYPVLLTLSSVLIVFFILRYCYNKSIFLKV